MGPGADFRAACYVEGEGPALFELQVGDYALGGGAEALWGSAPGGYAEL